MKRLFLFAVVLLAWTLPAAGQEGGSCAIILNQVNALVGRLGTDPSSGETAHDANLLEQIRGLLDRYEAGCLPPAPSIPLAAGTFTLRYDSDTGRALTFAYPEGWIVEQDLAGGFQVGFVTAGGLTDRLSGSEAPTFAPGEALIYVAAEGLNSLGFDFDPSMRPVEIIAAMLEETEEIAATADPVAFSVNDRAAARVTFAGDGFEGALYLITFATDDAALMIVLTAPGKLAPVDDLALRMARSMRISALDLGASQTVDAGGVSYTFHYPDGWALQQISDDLYLIANSAQILAENAFAGADLPDMAPGEVALMVRANSAQTYGFDPDSGLAPTALQILESVIQASGSLPGTLGAVTPVMIDQRSAAQVDLTASGSAARLLVVDLGAGRFGLMVLVTAPGELERNAGALMSVAASFAGP